MACPRRTLFRPCIDLHNGRVKQIVGGTLTDKAEDLKENFVAEHGADWFAERYKSDGLRGGHVIKLGPGNEEAALSALRAYPQGLQLGGGITAENAMKFIEAGASHVIATSSLFTGDELDMKKVITLREAVGKDRLVIDLSCRRRGDTWHVATNRWQTVTDFQITEENLKKLEVHCSEFLVHAADVEGLQRGIDEDLVKFLGEHVSIPTTYAGGATSIEDLRLVHRLSGGKVDLTIGSALDVFGGSLPYAHCVAYNNNSEG